MTLKKKKDIEDSSIKKKNKKNLAQSFFCACLLKQNLCENNFFIIHNETVY